MIYIDETPEAWSTRHGIEVVEMKCANCEKVFKCDVPIRIKGYAGFQMRMHGCSHNFLGATFTPNTESTRSIWNNIL